jgi:hypothetical protein
VLNKLDDTMGILIHKLQTATKNAQRRERIIKRGLIKNDPNRLSRYSKLLIFDMKSLVKTVKREKYTVSYQYMTDNEKHLAHATFITAQVMKKLLETPLLDNNGDMTNESRFVLDESRVLINNTTY